MQTTHDLYTVYMQQAEERPMQQAPVPDELRVLESAYAFFQPVVLPPRAVRPRMKDATTQTPTINHTTTQAGDLLSLLEVAKMSSKLKPLAMFYQAFDQAKAFDQAWMYWEVCCPVLLLI